MLVRFFSIVLFFSFSWVSYSQNVSVEFTFYNDKSDSVVIGTVFGSRQVSLDTLIKSSEGKVLWQPSEVMPPGIYFAWLKSDNTFIQILINGEETRMSFEVDLHKPKEIIVNKSSENELFHKYLRFLGEQQQMKDSVIQQINILSENGEKHDHLDIELENIRRNVAEYQKNVAEANPGTLTAFLLKGNLEPEVPEFDLEDDTERQAAGYYYYRDHYFDNIDMSHPALMRSSFIHTKVNDYIHNVSYLHPDSMKVAIDTVMKKLEVNPEAYRYFLADLLNNYSRLSIAGQDALYVHLVDRYFNTGKAPWTDQTSLIKINRLADSLRPSLLGNIMADFTTYRPDGSPVRLHDIEAEYTVLFFWDPTCAHCKKVFPVVREFNDKYREEGKVEVITICSKGGERYPRCWEYINDNGFGHMLNTGDEFQRYNEIHRFTKFPKAVILDKNKKVISKDFNPDRLESIFLKTIRA